MCVLIGKSKKIRKIKMGYNLSSPNSREVLPNHSRLDKLAILVDLMKELKINDLNQAIAKRDKEWSEHFKNTTNKVPDNLSPSEAVYAFAAWLTTKKEKTVFSGTDDATQAADLVKQFTDSQGFAEPREDFFSRIKPYPKDKEVNKPQ